MLMCAAVVIALAGCALTGTEPSPSATPSPSETSTPTPSAEPLTLVECEVLLPIDQARALFGADTEFLGERPIAESGGWFPLAEIDSTLADATQVRSCAWGVPNSDGVFTVAAVEVTPEQRSTLETALTDAGFTDVTTGTVTGFEMTGENEVGPTAATHLFSGPVWIMSNAADLGTTGPAANAALESLRTANPTLGL